MVASLSRAVMPCATPSCHSVTGGDLKGKVPANMILKAKDPANMIDFSASVSMYLVDQTPEAPLRCAGTDVVTGFKCNAGIARGPHRFAPAVAHSIREEHTNLRDPFLIRRLRLATVASRSLPRYSGTISRHPNGY